MNDKIKTTPFEFFNGKTFELTGVDFNHEILKYIGYEKSDYSEPIENVINFVLDGVTYTAIEDPSDGYRSSIDCIVGTDFKVNNIFSPVQVICCEKTKSEYSECEILTFKTQDEKIIIEVGTDNTDDYYPFFVGRFLVENLPQNQGI